jgi:dTDP-glucose 4,6-dehydratase
LYVIDHCEAIWAVIEKGRVGDTYNVGGRSEMKNIDTVHAICDAVAEATGKPAAAFRELITFVEDRPGHDLRYAIDASKLERECGWKPQESFQTGLARTVRFYLEQRDWVEHVRSGEYRTWIDKNYGARLAT